MNDEIDSEYLTYNGFNRPALVAGVPLMLMLPILGFAIFGGFIFVNIFGLFGIIPVGISLLSIIVIRAMTDNDPNALRVVRFNLKGFFIKLGKPILAVRGRE
ncbi:VirB3 family type IV secretion system protein [Providencia huaxiensis]|uniref:VirB3 family type IV secretion system protein n=1 Tax=Providencia huaxiensis TaxID=2027290 RepID=UPI000C7F30E1|nr:VirB3 family type IV secretion system protein [Providencia huaxiensis]AXH60550.1 conjugal transfer protein TraD [Providencia huaxiensis]